MNTHSLILSNDPLADMIDRFANFSWSEFSISGPVISSLIIMGLMLIFFIIVAIQDRFHDPLKPAKGPLFLAIWFYEWVENWAIGNMGKRPGGMLGYFYILFIYLFLSFIWSITGLPSVIDYFLVPLSLSIVMFILIQATALRYQKWGYFHRYIEPVPFWLPINLLTMWTPIVSTSLRMLGNALAGSIVVGLVNWALKKASLMLFGFLGAAGQIFLGPLIIGVLNLYFGLFSGGVQTLVFVSLNAVWIGQEMPEDDAMGLERQATRPEENKEKKAI